MKKKIDALSTGNLTSYQATLNDLALQLATNYCTVSFGEKEKADVKLNEIFHSESECLKHFNKKNGKVEDILQHRNILIIGAGGSHDSFRCLPLGKDIMDTLKTRYETKLNEFPAIREKFDMAKNDLELQQREVDFENYLSVLSDLILTPDEIRKEIQEFADFQHGPCLFYETIAHLFKHSFIDVIINFNFDELLDNAIKDEVGSENYYHIISDGDCVPVNDIMVDGRLKVPIYIKPHGTVSHKSTLRFTKRHYLDVPEQIKKLITELVGGKRGESWSMIKRVNLISVGYNMQSLEFTEILNNHLPEQSKIYHFTYEDLDPKDEADTPYIKKILGKFYRRSLEYTTNKNTLVGTPLNIKSFNNSIYTRIAVCDFNKGPRKTREENKLTSPYAEAFSYIWRQTYYQFKEIYRPRSIGRHEIISYFFYDPLFCNDQSPTPDLKSYCQERVNYFRDRVLVEIAIAINRNNGIVDITQMLTERVGIYYDLYRKKCIRYKDSQIKKVYSIYDLISEFTSKPEEDFSYSKHLFKLQVLDKDKFIEVPEDFSKDSFAFRQWIMLDGLRSGKRSVDKSSQLVSELYKMLNTCYDKDSKVSATVLYYLFSSNLLSTPFILNFKRNFKELVFNYRRQLEKEGVREPDVLADGLEAKVSPSGDFAPTEAMIHEIGRLFRKSVNSHYYHIRAKFNDTRNYLVESFSRRKIQHTNLALEYNFRKLLLKKEWDRLLIISETGSLLNFLQFESLERTHFQDRKIIMINAFEPIKQLFPSKTDNHRIDQQQRLKSNKQRFTEYLNTSVNAPIDDPGMDNVIETLTIPSGQHNQHVVLFLKKIVDGRSLNLIKQEYPVYEIEKEKKTDGDRAFSMVGAFYFHRPGFSNSINPIFVGNDPYGGDKEIIQKDLKKLIRIFAIYFCRALNFESLSIRNSEGKEFFQEHFREYLTWNWKEERRYINNFLSFLYDLDNITWEYNG